MTDGLPALATALWLGLLTSISPCPLATNIAAISFVGRQVGNSRRVFVSGLLYTLGRIGAYVALGSLIVMSLLSIPKISMFFQNYMNKFIESKNRATVLSAVSMSETFARAIMYPLIGLIIQYSLTIGSLVIGLLIMVVSFFSKVEEDMLID